MELFAQQIINGLQLGAIYALMALGYTMVYGILKLINFAHGDLLMIGAYTAYFLLRVELPLAAALGGAMLLCAAGAVVIDKVAYKPLRKQVRLKALITAMGVSLLLENGCRALPFIGPAFRPFPQAMKVWEVFSFGIVSVTNVQCLSFAFTFILMFLLWTIIQKTKLGTAMRAVALDPTCAKLMGIDVEFVIAATFAIGGALAGAAGVMFAVTYPRISPYMGIMPGLKAFIAAVFGGIGSIPGAMAGGLLMGLVETLATAMHSHISEGVFFVVLIAVLLVRPFGLLGRMRKEKV
jgi:branched-chain amino acid transport system permease protein